jgi:hypothetical protein
MTERGGKGFVVGEGIFQEKPERRGKSFYS